MDEARTYKNEGGKGYILLRRPIVMHQVLYCPKSKNTLANMNGKYFCQNCAHFYPMVDNIPPFVDQKIIIDSFAASTWTFPVGFG